MKSSIASAFLLGSALAAPAFADSLTRVVTIPIGGEITGMLLQGDDLFFNVQHPADDMGNDFARATVGVISNAAFDAGEVPVPEGADTKIVTSSLGAYQILVQEGSFGRIGHITGADGEIKVSNDPDFNAFVPTGDAEGYLFTNWEDRPGGMSRIKLMRAGDGTWSVDASDAGMIDFSAVGGTWVNCFGTLSPWSTPLTSEELYFDDTAEWNNAAYSYIAGVEALARYLGDYPNPYRYGYIVEITDPAGSATPVKHFALGRFSHENAVVMPDDRTVYLSDDGTDVVFFKFVADTAGDLSAGTLYAAKATQQTEPGAAAADTAFDIAWIELAHGSNTEIEGWIAEYDGITQDDFTVGATSYISEAEIAAWAAGDAPDDRVAFLESRKAAAAKGATAEFRKMEGVNINYMAARDGSVPFMYMAMSEVSKGMADAVGDVQVSEVRCGIVYAFPLEADFNVTRMIPAVVGGAYDRNAGSNACDVAAIANPDNLVILADGAVLIGEDSGSHANNAMWLWKKDAM